MGEELNWWIKALSYAGFSALGGVMGHLMRTLNKKGKITLGRCLVEGVAAGFVGLLVLLLCQAMAVGEQWTGVIVGVSGWLGASATIQTLEGLVRKRLNLGTENDTPTQLPPSA